MLEKSEFIFSLLKASTRVERRLDRALSATKGVSFTEYHLLKQLHDRPDSAATRVDLASASGLTASAITRALKPLEKIGFVETEKSEHDARRSIARLTSAGNELLTDAARIVDDEIALLKLPDGELEGVTQTLSQL
jgi:DNA-binding MarR family transcriptional regulator